MENNNCGQIKISNEVVATIAGLAALEVEGVESSQSLTDKILKNNGVKILIEDELVTLDIMLVVKFGVSIPDIAFKVQENVKNAVENMTGLEVSQVNVHVQGVSFKKEKEEKKN
ncbi:Asp23/Gls24 family envelope stress response protein [Peptacetobacter hominis]|uniref:Asp23/Gls24 family envelope stress response protein n=1 Tax=Peptacetobacter hominis TaxID=2743610 RepID=A0A544QVD6_9FIRM|nr:Asp23/Gls24 family envelope stress response protein [Peptacetobacter hominis]TQQ84658.1 Asp23/Gls24 family envelope stress response protein [Peptacetobacter hominis]